MAQFRNKGIPIVHPYAYFCNIDFTFVDKEDDDKLFETSRNHPTSCLEKPIRQSEIHRQY